MWGFSYTYIFLQQHGHVYWPRADVFYSLHVVVQ